MFTFFLRYENKLHTKKIYLKKNANLQIFHKSNFFPFFLLCQEIKDVKKKQHPETKSIYKSIKMIFQINYSNLQSLRHLAKVLKEDLDCADADVEI